MTKEDGRDEVEGEEEGGVEEEEEEREKKMDPPLSKDLTNLI